jgi:hypothetical protein
MSSIIVYTTTADLDRLSIPSIIYADTIAHNTTAIITYFENNPQIMLQFAGFNSALKRANQLNYEKKCGCFYTFPWNTQYNVVNNVSSTILNFSQQVELYQYMIMNWNNGQSYMHYLSTIALSILLKIKRTKYNIDRGLCNCVSPLTTRTFQNNYAFIQYLRENNILL